MSGLYYGLSIVAVFIVIHWVVQNDGKETTNGLLAMRGPDLEGK